LRGTPAIAAAMPRAGSILLQYRQFGISVAQAQREGAGYRGDQIESEFLVALGDLVELLAREHIYVSRRVGDGIVAARPVIEKGQAAEEIAAPEAGHVFGPAGAQGALIRRSVPPGAEATSAITVAPIMPASAP
jgi:hypothetical protein